MPLYLALPLEQGSDISILVEQHRLNRHVDRSISLYSDRKDRKGLPLVASKRILHRLGFEHDYCSFAGHVFIMFPYQVDLNIDHGNIMLSISERSLNSNLQSL